MRWLRARTWEIAAAAILAAIYVAVLAALPKHVFWHPDEGGKFLQMASLRWEGGLRATLPYGAAQRDAALRFYPTRCAGNRVYPEMQAGSLQFQWPIWFPLAAGPLYALWGATGIYVIPLVSGWLTAVLAASWVRPYSRMLAAGTILLVGLATPVAYYGFAFLEHTLATLLCLLGLWSLCRQPRTYIATACGFAAFLAATALRIEMIVFAVAAGMGWLVAGMRTSPAGDDRSRRARPFRREAWLLAGAALLLAGLALPLLTPRHWEALRQLPELIAATSHKLGFLFESLRYILINAHGVGATQVTTGAETIALLSLFTCLLAPFLGARHRVDLALLVALALLVELSFVITLLSQAYAARQGLFAVAPFLAIGMYPLLHAWRARDPALLCLAVTGAAYLAGSLVLLFITRIGYSGDYLIGLEGPARYVLVFYPLWAALSVIGLHLYRTSERPAIIRSGVTLLVLLAVGMSVTYQARGILAVDRSRQTFARWAAQLPWDRPVVTSEWWLGAAVAPYFLEHEMYCVTSIASLPEWVAFAQAHGIDAFTFAARRGEGTAPSVTTGLPLQVDSDKEVDGLRIVELRLTGGRQPPSAESTDF